MECAPHWMAVGAAGTPLSPTEHPGHMEPRAMTSVNLPVSQHVWGAQIPRRQSQPVSSWNISPTQADAASMELSPPPRRMLLSGNTVSLSSGPRARSQSPTMVLTKPVISRPHVPCAHPGPPFMQPRGSAPESHSTFSRSPSPTSQDFHAPRGTWSPRHQVMENSGSRLISAQAVGSSTASSASRTPAQTRGSTPRSAQRFKGSSPTLIEAKLEAAQKVAKSALEAVRSLTGDTDFMPECPIDRSGVHRGVEYNKVSAVAAPPPVFGVVKAPALPQTLRGMPVIQNSYPAAPAQPTLSGRKSTSRSTGALPVTSRVGGVDGLTRSTSSATGSKLGINRGHSSSQDVLRPVPVRGLQRLSSPVSSKGVTATLAAAPTPPLTSPSAVAAPASATVASVPALLANAEAMVAAAANDSLSHKTHGRPQQSQQELVQVETLLETIQAALRGAKTIIDSKGDGQQDPRSSVSHSTDLPQSTDGNVGHGTMPADSPAEGPTRQAMVMTSLAQPRQRHSPRSPRSRMLQPQQSPRDLHRSPRDLRQSPCASSVSSVRQVVGGSYTVSANMGQSANAASWPVCSPGTSERSMQDGSLQASIASGYGSALACGPSQAFAGSGPELSSNDGVDRWRSYTLGSTWGSSHDSHKADAGVQVSPWSPSITTHPIGDARTEAAAPEDWTASEEDAQLMRKLERLQAKLLEVSLEVTEVQNVAKLARTSRSRGTDDLQSGGASASTRGGTTFTEDSPTPRSPAMTASTGTGTSVFRQSEQWPPSSPSRPNTPPLLANASVVLAEASAILESAWPAHLRPCPTRFEELSPDGCWLPVADGNADLTVAAAGSSPSKQASSKAVVVECRVAGDQTDLVDTGGAGGGVLQEACPGG